MNPLQWPGRIKEYLAKPIIAKMIPIWKVGHKIPAPLDFIAFAREGYMGNTLIYACIDELATSLAESPLLAEQGSGEDWKPYPALQTVIDKPNSEQTQEEWLREWMMHYGYAGNVFQHIVRSPVNRVAEMWALKPHRIKIIPGADGKVQSYVHTVEGQESQPILARDIVHDKNLDPLDDYWGMSPILVLAMTGNLDNEAVKYLADFFYNAGQPALVLKLKQVVERAERERVKARWKDEYGRDGFHGIAVLDADAEIQELGSRPDQLGLAGIFDTTESRICMTFGVHPMIIAARLGLLRSTMANYEQAEQAFQLRTMEQHRRRIEAKLTKFFRAELGIENIRVRFDRSVVPALQEDMEPNRAFAILAYKERLATLNEARDIAGMEAVDGPEGNEFKAEPVPPGEDGEDGEDAPPDEGNAPARRNGNARTLSKATWHAIGTNENGATTHIDSDGQNVTSSVGLLERTALDDRKESYAVAIDTTARAWESRFYMEAEIQFGKERLALGRALRRDMSMLADVSEQERVMAIIARTLTSRRAQ